MEWVESITDLLNSFVSPVTKTGSVGGGGRGREWEGVSYRQSLSCRQLRVWNSTGSALYFFSGENKKLNCKYPFGVCSFQCFVKITSLRGFRVGGNAKSLINSCASDLLVCNEHALLPSALNPLSFWILSGMRLSSEPTSSLSLSLSLSVSASVCLSVCLSLSVPVCLCLSVSRSLSFVRLSVLLCFIWAQFVCWEVLDSNSDFFFIDFFILPQIFLF